MSTEGSDGASGANNSARERQSDSTSVSEAVAEGLRSGTDSTGAAARNGLNHAGGVLDSVASHVDPNDDPETLNRAAGELDGSSGTPESRAAAADAEVTAFDPEPPATGFMQSMRETVAERIGGAVGRGQAAVGWAADMVGGAVSALETGYEATIAGLEEATGLIDDDYAARQRADLQARADAVMAAAEQVWNDPVGVAEAFAESYEARFAAADKLEKAYRSGHGDLSVLQEAARIRAEASTELGILGVETAAITAGGAGAIAKGLRAARLADVLGDARPMAMAMATADHARDTTRAVDELIDQPERTALITVQDIENRVTTETMRRTAGRATGRGQPVGADWLRSAVVEKRGAAIPEEIATKLADREFSDFRRFREAFWTSVAADPALAGQFSPSNLARMQQGLAPAAPRSQQVGGRVSFELDHIQPLSQGGQTYDTDNIQIMTPRAHIEKSRNER